MKKYFQAFVALSLLNLTACSSTQADYSAMSSRELLAQCTTDMATTFHIHSHLTIMADQKNVIVPTEIGIDRVKNCMSSLHTHDESGVIHIESPVQKDFTLGDFFYNWKQPFSSTQVASHSVDTNHGLKLFVDGKESTDFENLVLTDEQSIFVDYYDLNKGPDPVPVDYKFEE